MTWTPPPGQPGRALGRALAAQYDVHEKTNCTTCHR
jgi:hypothetical protein